MTPPPDIVGSLSRSRALRRPLVRRSIFVVLILACALLTFFPERYRAAVTLTPTDPGSLGLGNALGQLGAQNTVFGSQAAVEISLKIGNSVATRAAVSRRLNLRKRLGLKDEVEVSRWLEKNLEIRSLRGGIVQVEHFSRDPTFATELVGITAEELRSRLSTIARRQTAYKREVLVELVGRANQRMNRAQDRYDEFRRRTRFSNPTFAIDSIGGRIPILQAAIKAKEVELNAARQFNTDENIQVKQILAEISSLRAQLAQFRNIQNGGDQSLGRVVVDSTESQKLERELYESQVLYYNYRNFLAGTMVEDLTSTANIRILEQAYIDTARQWRVVPAALGVVLLLLLLAIEFYRLRPPVGDRLATA